MISNLVRYRGDQAMPQEVIFLDIKNNPSTLYTQTLAEGVTQKIFHFDKDHNWYVSFKKMKDALAPGRGVIISNDLHDLIMVQAFNTGKKIIQIVHDGYNVQLSLKFEEVIDKFIAHSRFFYDVLSQLLPHRREDIVHIPYGIPVSGKKRKPNPDGPLRLLFLGRMRDTKGIFDLPLIQQTLLNRNIPAEWTFIGSGADREKLIRQWSSFSPARFEAPTRFEEVIELCAGSDIFVFPTQFEGFPVSLLETMSVGVVPVVSDLPGGIREIVTEETGFRCALKDTNAFANAIETLHNNRALLETYSNNCMQVVDKHFNAVCQSPKYQDFFKACMEEEKIPRHELVNKKIGSRLDQPWIPDFVTTNLRKLYAAAVSKRVDDSV